MYKLLSSLDTKWMTIKNCTIREKKKLNKKDKH